MRRSILIALAMCTLAPPANVAAAPRTLPIQPGAQVATPRGTCTLNFVFREANGTTYIGTAGHCGREGQVARTLHPNREIGPIVFSEERPAPGIDFALIRIDPARYGEVEPAMRLFGGPVGLTNPRRTEPGDLLAISGYGVGAGSFEATRHRFGSLLGDDENQYLANMAAVPGDSGGPVLHFRTGEALGVISRFNLDVPASTDIGPTVQRILERLRSDRPTISLVTAPLAT